MSLERFLRLAEVEQATGLRKSAIYRRIADGRFPEPIRLGPKASRWPESAVARWQNEARFSDAERALLG